MKLALCLGTAPTTAEAAVRRMLAAQTHHAGAPIAIHRLRAGALGVVGRPGDAPGTLLRRHQHNGNAIAVTGVPVARGSSLDAQLGAALENADEDASRRLQALDGAYVAAFWNEARGELALVTDCLGMQPLYAASRGEVALYASELKGIVAAGETGAEPEPDAAGWGAVFYFGHPVSARTTLAGVRRVPAATVIAHATPGAVPDERRYWEWPAIGGLPAAAASDRIVPELRRDVAAYAERFPASTLLLSGGFDSRLNLALAREAGVRPRLVIQSHPDENADADGNFAAAVARGFGLPVERVSARADYFSSDAYLQYLERNEIVTPSLYLFIANVASIVTPAMGAVWEGCVLGPGLKFGKGAQGFDAYLREAMHARRARHQEAARLLFRPEWLDELERGFDAELAAERARLGEDATASWRFNVETRARFRTGTNPYQVYDTSVPALTPGLSKASWEAICTADHAARLGKQLYFDLFARHFPRALAVPVASGADMYNPGGRAAVRYHRQRLAATAAHFLQRPKVARALGRVGFERGFAWEPSRFPRHALMASEPNPAVFDVAAVDRLRHLSRAPAPAEQLAIEMLFYMESWRHIMRGDLRSWMGAQDGRATPAAVPA